MLPNQLPFPGEFTRGHALRNELVRTINQVEMTHCRSGSVPDTTPKLVAMLQAAIDYLNELSGSGEPTGRMAAPAKSTAKAKPVKEDHKEDGVSE